MPNALRHNKVYERTQNISYFALVRRGGSGKTNGVRKKEVVAVEGTENATGDNSEIRRFLKRRGRLRELSFYRTLSINDEDP